MDVKDQREYTLEEVNTIGGAVINYIAGIYDSRAGIMSEESQRASRECFERTVPHSLLRKWDEEIRIMTNSYYKD